jgi:tetratricopeptide (TPR) repeat protein
MDFERVPAREKMGDEMPDNAPKQENFDSLESAATAIESLVEDGDLGSAEDLLGEAIQRFGMNDSLLILQAELVLEDEDYRGAIAACKEALDKVKKDHLVAKLLAYKGYAHYYLDELEEARNQFNQSIHHDPELFTAVLGRAMVHEQEGFALATRIDLDRAIFLDDQQAVPFSMRGMLHLRSGATEDAARDLGFALESNPDDEESRLNLARIRAIERRSRDAMELLEPLVEDGEDPELAAPAAILRSQLSLAMGSTEAAIEDAERAIEIMADAPWGHLQLAACHLAAGLDPGKAIEALKQAESHVENIRDLPDVIALRAEAYSQLGKEDREQQNREVLEGTARLPAFVYGPLNPVGDIPLNPAKPIDIRSLLGEIFGEARNAPDGYENVLREVVSSIPQIIKDNPGVGTIHVELPEAQGMVGGRRQLVIQTGQSQSA